MWIPTYGCAAMSVMDVHAGTSVWAHSAHGGRIHASGYVWVGAVA